MEVDNVLERLDRQISDWQGKLEAARKEAGGLDGKITSLKAKRDSYVLSARGENNQAAQTKLSTAKVKLIELIQDQQELTVFISQVEQKIAELEGQKAARQRDAKVIELNELREQRFALDAQIESHTEALVKALGEYQAVSNELTNKAHSVGVKHARLEGRSLVVNYLNCQLRPLFPMDFGGVGYSVRSLVSVDEESLNGIFEGNGLLPKAEKIEAAG